MTRYVKSDSESKAIKTLVTKYVKNVPIKTDRLQGKFTVKNIRRYKFHTEVDLQFKGKINAKIGRTCDWYSSDIKLGHKDYRISKVKLNRYIRKSIYKDVSHQLQYFSESLKYYSDVKKIEWI